MLRDVVDDCWWWPTFLEEDSDDEYEKDEEDEDEDAGDVKDEKLWLLPEVVSVSGALPMLLFVPKLANPGKGANAEAWLGVRGGSKRDPFQK